MNRRVGHFDFGRFCRWGTRHARYFRRDEDGSILIFSLMIFTLMLLIAGISLDIERFESARTRIQATADGAALAAASLTQNVSAEELVADYFRKAGLAQYYNGVRVNSRVNSNEVTVLADVNVPTHFFNMIGVENLHTNISSVAAESIENVEISLVLDVSGSMGQNNKIDNLITAAEDFVDAIYLNAPPDSISISVVPYSTQVSVGPEVMSHLTGRGATAHDKSSCIDFGTTHFDSTALDLAASHVQTTHMDARTSGTSSWQVGQGLRIEECPTYGWTDILVASQDKTDLKDYFRRFTNTNWTSIELGVKWGAALLDPSFQPVVTGLIGSGDVDPVFDGRPAAMNSTDTLKVMVVMTDGINTNQHMLNAPFRSGPSPIYVSYDASGRAFYSIWKTAGIDPILDPVFLIDGTPVLNWYLVNNHGNSALPLGWRTTPVGGTGAVRLDWKDVWAQVPVRVVADNWFAAMGAARAADRTQLKNALTVRGQADKDPYTLQICSAVKDQNIVIYTIGFEAPAAAQTLLRNCATSPSHAFDVAGTEISQAFSAIAADVARLRLLQ